MWELFSRLTAQILIYTLKVCAFDSSTCILQTTASLLTSAETQPPSYPTQEWSELKIIAKYCYIGTNSFFQSGCTQFRAVRAQRCPETTEQWDGGEGSGSSYDEGLTPRPWGTWCFASSALGYPVLTLHFTHTHSQVHAVPWTLMK